LVLNPRAGHGSSARWRTATGVGLLALAAVVAADAAGLAVDGDGLLWAVLLVGAGLSLFWGAGTGRELLVASDAQMKTLIGGALTLAGVGVILDRTGAFGVDAATLVGAVAVLLVLAFVFVPRALVAQRRGNQEKRRREREQERAEVGEMLHDSVLQTLALIQRREDTPAPVAALARRQERELRDWLLRGEVVGQRAESLDEGLRAIVAAIEDDHDAMIETVIVGDAPLSPAVEALLAATREALLNAVKHGDGAEISLFAKASATTAAEFVRDRGPGFDPAAIDETRRGIRSSIIERMVRVGGHADVYTAPGEGCEVELGAPL
jgi:signal transduction histidine kinase